MSRAVLPLALLAANFLDCFRFGCIFSRVLVSFYLASKVARSLFPPGAFIARYKPKAFLTCRVFRISNKLPQNGTVEARNRKIIFALE